MLSKVTPSDLLLEERRLLAYIKLLDASEPLKLAPLANDLGVSVTTLSADLDELSNWLKTYNLTLERKKGVGVELVGDEESKREALVSYSLIHFEDELIDHLFSLSNDQYQTDKLLFSFQREYLKVIDNIVYESINQFHLKIADRDYIAFVLHVCLSLSRTGKGFSVTKENRVKDSLKNSDEYVIVLQLQSKLSDLFSTDLPDEEIIYLATILRGSKLVDSKNMYYDRVLISRATKRLIQEVSKQLNIDLSADFSLFQGLLNHMEPTIYRHNKGLMTFNPLTEEIKEKYPFLFMAVKKGLATAFEEFSFTDDEIAYIVLHFGSALELNKEKVQIRALIICPTGIGTSKMLSSRLKTEVPEIVSTDVVSLKEMNHVDWKNYEIIISTVLLPLQQEFKYVYVNPLLYEKDVESIYEYLSTHLQEITDLKKKPSENIIQSQESTSNQSISLHTFMDNVDICQGTIRTILRNFSVHHMKNEPSYDGVIQKMLAHEANKGILTDVEDVFTHLKLREAKGGFGIPGTNMALVHCRHSGVKEMTFQIAHLESSYRLLGMDMKDMDVRNILLLLAPEKLNELQLEIISTVSTILVESKETMMIFSSANEKMIREKLESSFLSFLQNKFEKE